MEPLAVQGDPSGAGQNPRIVSFHGTRLLGPRMSRPGNHLWENLMLKGFPRDPEARLRCQAPHVSRVCFQKRVANGFDEINEAAGDAKLHSSTFDRIPTTQSRMFFRVLCNHKLPFVL